MLSPFLMISSPSPNPAVSVTPRPRLDGFLHFARAAVCRETSSRRCVYLPRNHHGPGPNSGERSGYTCFPPPTLAPDDGDEFPSSVRANRHRLDSPTSVTWKLFSHTPLLTQYGTSMNVSKHCFGFPGPDRLLCALLQVRSPQARRRAWAKQ